jgi:eukaryotic-like serine/threonine-protein kinase
VGEGHIMPEKLKCQECGTELTSAPAEGLCPHCLMGMGIKLSGARADAAGSGPEHSTLNRTRLAEGGVTHRLGDYELLQEIAHGGMGVVYRARQISLNRTVAVKMLLFGKFSSDEFVRRFHKEAEAAASLQHPNIVAIHEIGMAEGQHYYAMDFVEGENLAQMTKGRALPAKRAAAYLKAIAEAVQFAHHHGTLHRDLKPSNVIIDIFDQPRLTDFGLAKQFNAGDEQTATGAVLGSPGYMPPEQAGAKTCAIGPAADIYSMGAILYHLLTGRAPFTAETLGDTLWQVIHAEPIAPRLLNPSVPRDLETICLKCLEKNPRARFGSAQVLADELGRFLGGEPIQARPISHLEKIWRWCRRQPALAAAFALLIFLACSATGAALLFNRLRTEANRHRESARLARYASSISAAQWDLQQGNAAQAIQQLIASRPGAGETDLRGFEWRYLWRLSHPQPAQSLPRRPQVLGEMKLSPDGALLAAYYWDNTLRLWNITNGQEVLTVTNACSAGGFSADGHSVVAGCRAGSIRRYDLVTRTWSAPWTISGELVAHADEADLAVILDSAGKLRVWDAKSLLGRFSPQMKVARYMDYGYGRTVAISADGKTLAVLKASENSRAPSTIRLWDTGSGLEIKSLHGEPEIRALRFSPNGRLLATGGGNGVVQLWDWASGTAKRLEHSEISVAALAFSKDGQWIATADGNGSMRIWNVETGKAGPPQFPVQNRQIWSLAFLGAGKLLACGGRDSPISIWYASGNPAAEEMSGIRSDQWGNFAFSLDGKSLAAGFKDQHVRVWSVADFRLIADLRGACYAVAFTPDGKSLLTANDKDIPELWDLQNQTSRPVPHYAGGMRKVKAVDIDRTCRVAALGLMDGTIQLLDIVEGQELASWKAHQDEVKSVAFSGDGRRLLSGGRDQAFCLWDVASGKLLGSSSEHKGAVCAVTYSHGGSMIATGCGAGTIKLWRPEHTEKSEASMNYQQDSIRSLAFSVDDRTLASGSGDRTVKLWNVALRQCILSFELDSPIQLILFSGDGNALAVVTEAGTLRVFRAATLAEADADSSAR